MKKCSLLVLLVLLTKGTVSFAGYEFTMDLSDPSAFTVTEETTVVIAHLQAVADSGDRIQFLGCGVRADYDVATDTTQTSMFCRGRTPSRIRFYCSSDRPELVEAAALVNSSTYLYLRFTNSTKECTLLRTRNASYSLF